MNRLALIPGVLLATSTVVTSSCVRYSARAVAELPNNAPVRIRFEPPRQVAVVSGNRDTLRVGDVRVLTGKVLQVRGDTIRVAVRSVTTIAGPAKGIPKRSRADVVPAPQRPAEVIRGSLGGGLAAIASGVALGLAVVLVLLVSHGGS